MWAPPDVDEEACASPTRVVVAAARDDAAGGGGVAHAAPMTSGDGGVGDEREGYEWVRAMCLG